MPGFGSEKAAHTIPNSKAIMTQRIFMVSFFILLLLLSYIVCCTYVLSTRYESSNMEHRTVILKSHFERTNVFGLA